MRQSGSGESLTRRLVSHLLLWLAQGNHKYTVVFLVEDSESIMTEKKLQRFKASHVVFCTQPGGMQHLAREGSLVEQCIGIHARQIF